MTDDNDSDNENETAKDRSRRSGRRPTPIGKIGATAAQQLSELTGREAESVTGVERTDDGWTVQVEVVESRRVPDSADVMALYEVRTDGSGELEGYQRQRRYLRGQTREGSAG